MRHFFRSLKKTHEKAQKTCGKCAALTSGQTYRLGIKEVLGLHDINHGSHETDDNIAGDAP